METEHHCHVSEERAWLFHSEDTQSTEDEYLHLLHALVYSLKPLSILETGSYKGMATAFMAKALQRNGTGFIRAVEEQALAVRWTEEQLRVNGASQWGKVLHTDSVDYLKRTENVFDFAFFDSQLPLRCKELQICLDRKLLLPGSFFAMHDTSRLRTLTPGEPDPYTPILWNELESIQGIKFLEFPLSRGLILGTVI
jgi:predicted O-methyltransferase YrrM